jgi:hypothetical protein
MAQTDAVIKEVIACDPQGALNLIYQYIQTLQASSPHLTQQTLQGILPPPAGIQGGEGEADHGGQGGETKNSAGGGMDLVA